MDVYISQKEITVKLGISHTTLWRLRQSGVFPQPIQLSPRRLGWRLEDIEAFLQSREIQSPATTAIA